MSKPSSNSNWLSAIEEVFMDNNIVYPQALATLPNWVCWRYEPDPKHNRDAKVPYSPTTGKKALANKPTTWGTLTEALAAVKQYNYSGVGFMFTVESGIVGIDIDKCLDNGKPNAIAADILSRATGTFIETSPSGNGLHIYYIGTLPSGGNRNSKTGVEMYSHSRYFTFTGQKFGNSIDDIGVDSSGIIKYIHSNYVSNKSTKSKNKSTNSTIILNDDVLIKKAFNSKDKASFTALWNGQWQGKYPSQSEADFALCCKLAFWTNRDKLQIDRLFRQSGTI